jgi:hypothetical protein
MSPRDHSQTSNTLRGSFIWQPLNIRWGTRLNLPRDKPADARLPGVGTDDAYSRSIPILRQHPSILQLRCGENPQRSGFGFEQTFHHGYEFEIATVQAVTFSD